MQTKNSQNLESYIRSVEDFPNPDIRFYDIAPLLGDGAIFASTIEEMAQPLEGQATKIACLDARGFVFGGAMAHLLGVGCVMLRKPGKLPGETHKTNYDLEYGSNGLEIQSDVLNEDDRVVLVDDVIATGGTALAAIELVRKNDSEIIEFCSLIDLPHLGGSEKITEHGVAVRSLISIGASDE